MTDEQRPVSGPTPTPRPGSGSERSAASVKHLAGASREARKVAGARRNPSVVGYDETVPAWLRTTAGWSWRLLMVVAAVALIFYATAQVQLVFVAVFLALVITSVLRPVTDFYARIMPRGLATALAILSALLFFAGLLTYIITSVAGQWEELAGEFSDGIDQILDFLENGPLPVSITGDDVNEWIENGRQWLTEHGGDIASQAAASAGSVFEAFAAIALAIFCTVFFLARGKDLWTWFLNQLPARSRESWKIAGGAGWYTFSGYARGTVLIALADGALAFILLAILGVPLAAPLAVLVFIGAFIPIIGAPLAMIIAAVVALAADGFVTALIVTVGIALIGQFEGHILQPLIMGAQVSLHPVVVALAVTGGTLLAGILGAVVSVPLVAVAWAVFSKLRHKDPPMEDEIPTAKEIALSEGPSPTSPTRDAG
ncbi:AI-2E family transporter [Cellulosimicrobium sp. Marseille-Q4280]|uniref:AI-2E family transporter n=1 Tax=Cellulosimicrobium sp. Marseille-Q4280 TaxID=2937992 RepID=UPI00203F5EF2|nr:AI-2E family transporter [Cellulosimicrobium sp. Marseille-Q4280]